MIIGTVIFISLLGLSTGLVTVSWVMAVRLGVPSKRERLSRWLLAWLLKGLSLPVLIWLAMNLGLSWHFQAFMPQVQAARNHGGDWIPEFLEAAGAGICIISSYWTAATLGWVLWASVEVMQPEARKDFISLCRTSLLAMSVPAFLMLVLGGWTALGIATAAILAPVAGYATRLIEPQKLPPQYARVLARLKFGKYAEAEQEILRQLENHVDDFEGWLMLAGLYANHFNDLPEAERTIHEICDQPGLTPTRLSLALHRLADWHLQRGQDPDSARRALQIICEKLAGTNFAHLAQLRLNQMPPLPAGRSPAPPAVPLSLGFTARVAPPPIPGVAPPELNRSTPEC